MKNKINVKKLLVFFILFSALKGYCIPSFSSHGIINRYKYSSGNFAPIKVYDYGLSGFVCSVTLSREYVGNPAVLEDVNIELRLIVTDGTTEVDISHDYLGNSTVKTLINEDFKEQTYAERPSTYSKTQLITGQIPVAYNTWTVYIQFRYMQNGTWSSWVPSSFGYSTLDYTNYPKAYGDMPYKLSTFARENGNFPSFMPMTFIYPDNNTPVLTVGNSIYSPNNIYRLTLQTDGNVVIYKKLSATTEQALWSTQTQSANPNNRAGYLYFQMDGNFVLYYIPKINVVPAWSSERNSGDGLYSVLGNNAVLALQDDGNLVFYWRYRENGQDKSYVIGSSGTNNRVSSHPGLFN